MASSPMWKVYDARGVYQASCKEVEACAALMSLYGDGATIRYGHSASRIAWREGSEGQPASESWDHVAETAFQRINPFGDDATA